MYTELVLKIKVLNKELEIGDLISDKDYSSLAYCIRVGEYSIELYKKEIQFYNILNIGLHNQNSELVVPYENIPEHIKKSLCFLEELRNKGDIIDGDIFCIKTEYKPTNDGWEIIYPKTSVNDEYEIFGYERLERINSFHKKYNNSEKTIAKEAICYLNNMLSDNKKILYADLLNVITECKINNKTDLEILTEIYNILIKNENI